MHNKIFEQKTVTVSNNGNSSDSEDKAPEYYFPPFIVQDDHSIDLWGLHPGEDVQDDRFKDADSMRKYAEKQLTPDPVVSVEVVMDTNTVPIPGEEVYLTIPEKGSQIEGTGATTQAAYNTVATAVGFTWYPFDPSQGTDITYDNLQASILHGQLQSASLKRMEQLANAMLDRMPQVFYTQEDPSASGKNNIKKGAIWANPYGASLMKEGDKNGGQHNSGSTNKPADSSTSQ